MSISNVTLESVEEALGCEIPESYIVLAKHDVMGLDEDSIAEILQIDVKEIQDLKRDELYKQVRTHVGGEYAAGLAIRTQGWDGLEEEAIQSLGERMKYQKDPEFLLKVAAVANKAQRRGVKDDGIIDPTSAGRTAVVLTERLVHKMLNGSTQTAERSISIHDGSMERCTFDEVQASLKVPKAGSIKTVPLSESNQLRVEDLLRSMENK